MMRSEMEQDILKVLVSEEELKILSAVLNATMTGMTAQDITPELMERVMNSAGNAATLVPVII